jgi:acetylornithine deacetylase/succinyl-diaminopimelate desuccinylase-like protein
MDRGRKIAMSSEPIQSIQSCQAIQTCVDSVWQSSILPALHEYIAIPNESPAFDPEWREHGHMDRAVDLIANWIRGRKIAGGTLEVVRLGRRTPLLMVEIPARSSVSETVLLYGHLDKQPPMEGWSAGLAPWTPVLRDGRLYGRGAADDGYAAFASIAAIEALQAEGLPHARCVVLIEACEESGSFDLPAYIDALAPRIGSPDLVICLDSGCASYDRLWVTTSLRGLVGGTLSVSTLTEGVHSGGAGGVVPSTFRIARLLLERLEDAATGTIRLPEFHAEIPPERIRQACEAATALGSTVHDYPFAGTTQAIAGDASELILNRTWRPALEVIGAGGFPPLERAGNVLRPTTSLKLSIRLPPTVDATRASALLTPLFETDPPYGASVRFEVDQGSSGWNAPPLAPWLASSLACASEELFGRPACFLGEGGTIPFMAMLGERFPRAQFVITGVLGPQSNAHGPNEFLDVATAKRLTGAIAAVLADHHRVHASASPQPESRPAEKEVS